MRLLFLLLCSLFIQSNLYATSNNPLESDEALRARIKIKFALDPLLSKEKITLQHQNGQLLLVGQVDNSIIAEQALFLIQQSDIEPKRIKNELIVDNKKLSPEKKQSLIEEAAKARLEAASKYQMKNIPFVGIKLTFEKEILTVSGPLNDEQKKEIRSVLQSFKQIKSIKFADSKSDPLHNL